MPLSFGRPQVGLTAGGATGPGTPEPNTPFRILILRNFTGWAAQAPPPAAAPAPPPGDAGDLIGQVMAATAGRAPEPSAAEADDWRAFLRDVVSPHLLPSVDYGKQAELTAVVDDAAGARMRAVLH